MRASRSLLPRCFGRFGSGGSACLSCHVQDGCLGRLFLRLADSHPEEAADFLRAFVSLSSAEPGEAFLAASALAAGDRTGGSFARSIRPRRDAGARHR